MRLVVAPVLVKHESHAVSRRCQSQIGAEPWALRADS